MNAPGDNLNGVFAYSANSTFPNNASTATGDNFWVDIVFNDSGHLPPVLSNVAASASYAAGATATTLSSGTTVSDPGGSTTLVSGTVSISSGLFTGDMLAASTSGTNITASYSASTGVLSLTGTDTLAHYQQVLDSVSYSSSNQNPTNYGADPSRTVSWVVNDGTLSSATQTTTVNITGGPATASLFSPSAIPGADQLKMTPSAVESRGQVPSLDELARSSASASIRGRKTPAPISAICGPSGTCSPARPSPTRPRAAGSRSTFRARSALPRAPPISPPTTPRGEYSADRQLLRHRPDQRTADRALEPSQRRQRGLCLWRNQHHRHLPDQHLQCQQLLGRRGIQPGSTPRHRRCSAMWRRLPLIPRVRHRRHCRRARRSATPKARTSSRERCRSPAAS